MKRITLNKNSAYETVTVASDYETVETVTVAKCDVCTISTSSWVVVGHSTASDGLE